MPFKGADPDTIEASARIAELQRALEDSGGAGPDREQFLVRTVFCLFADDIGIFQPRDIFVTLVIERTRADGADLGEWLARLFQVLSTEPRQRAPDLDADLCRFPHVPGDLFRDALAMPVFDRALRHHLIAAAGVDWSRLSPALFGWLFQSIRAKAVRRAQGAHYTDEKSILKLIEPLFLDRLRAELERIKGGTPDQRGPELAAFQRKLGRIAILDPACGCGDFLIVAYRELRALEIEVLRQRRGDRSGMVAAVTLDQVHGIEIDPVPARIARAALLVIDRIMDNRLGSAFGPGLVHRSPPAPPGIVVGNALELAWPEMPRTPFCGYILGNPPFVGHQWRSKAQQADMVRIWGKGGQVHRLDYVTCWFKVAAACAAANQSIRIGFVATNSITQGEQAGILWPVILAGALSIEFAHRPFQWPRPGSGPGPARGKAAVQCVIIGLTAERSGACVIYEYDQPCGEPRGVRVSRINGYLVEGPPYVVPARSKPRPGLLPMRKGSQPTDGARRRTAEAGGGVDRNLILDDRDRDALLATAPQCAAWLRPYVGGDELISGKWRWCLWLKDVDPQEVFACAAIAERLERVRRGRLQSPTASVRAWARFPTRFTQDRQPDSPYLAIPEVSSETRDYIPMAILPPTVIASNKMQIIPKATLLYFGILMSAMHMAWMRTVGGRLESRYSYAPAIYHSFPWPDLTPEQEDHIANLAQAILAVRAEFHGWSLAELYDPAGMPPLLRRAHCALDQAVDHLYRRLPFTFERERIEHLFALREKS